MKEIVVQNKEEYFIKAYPLANPPSLSDKRRCLHCDDVITVGDFKVFKKNDGFEYICCPNAPGCDGTAVDWVGVL